MNAIRQLVREANAVDLAALGCISLQTALAQFARGGGILGSVKNRRLSVRLRVCAEILRMRERRALRAPSVAAYGSSTFVRDQGRLQARWSKAARRRLASPICCIALLAALYRAWSLRIASWQSVPRASANSNYKARLAASQASRCRLRRSHRSPIFC